MSKFYAVKKGREGSKIYFNWNECHKNVSGFSGAVFKSFKNLETALKYLDISMDAFNKNKPQIPTMHSLSPDTISLDSLTPEQSSISSLSLSPTSLDFAKVMEEIEQCLGLNRNNMEKLLEQKLNELRESKEFPELKSIIVYTDGSCINQGTGRAKAGSGICFPQFGWEISLTVPGKQTNNRGELFAVLAALKLLENLDSCSNMLNKSIPVEIHLDSTYVMGHQLNNIANLDLWGEFLKVLKLFKVKWIKELAHSGVWFNEKADQLAKVVAFS